MNSLGEWKWEGACVSRPYWLAQGVRDRSREVHWKDEEDQTIQGIECQRVWTSSVEGSGCPGVKWWMWRVGQIDHTVPEAYIVSGLPVTWDNKFPYCLRQFKLGFLLVSTESVLMHQSHRKLKISAGTSLPQSLEKGGVNQGKGHPAVKPDLLSRGQLKQALG